MPGSPAIGPTGLPLINANGSPAICKAAGCCGGGGTTVNCSICGNGIVPEYVRVSLDGVTFSPGDGTSPCQNCDDCEEANGLSFIVPYSGEVAGACWWIGDYDVDDLTTCGGVLVTVEVQLSSFFGTPLTLALNLHSEVPGTLPPGCISRALLNAQWEKEVSTIPDWSCSAFVADFPPDPTDLIGYNGCHIVSGGSLKIEGI